MSFLHRGTREEYDDAYDVHVQDRRWYRMGVRIRKEYPDMSDTRMCAIRAQARR